LRVKAGLSYDASASFTRGTVAGEFAISSFTQTENTARAVELALATLARLRHDGLAAERIDTARNYLLGQYPLALETATDWAVAFAELDLYGLPESYIGEFGTELTKVDASAIHAVIDQAYPSSGDLDIVLIGDAARIRDAAAKFGPVTELPLAAPDFTPAAEAR
jgi:predicted Zn-dependent peptidase